MRERVKILDVLIDKVDTQRALARVAEFVEADTNKLIVTPNSEMIVQSEDDLKLQEIINRADLALPDGAGVVLASQILGESLPERVPGIDLVQNLFQLGVERDYSFYFLGAAPNVAKLAQKRVLERYSALEINYHHGYLTRLLEEKVINDIMENEPNILLVGMGVPLQEKWLAKHLTKFDGIVGIGVGGAFDILAGTKSRAPDLMQQLKLEWLYRLLQEPRRIGRTLRLPKFIMQVLRQRYQN
jgi:N-acetylglucosaminyldiphosphoundecaprenol N-acetyl-beta-D-mannosaminyltransferase